MCTSYKSLKSRDVTVECRGWTHDLLVSPLGKPSLFHFLCIICLLHTDYIHTMYFLFYWKLNISQKSAIPQPKELRIAPHHRCTDHQIARTCPCCLSDMSEKLLLGTRNPELDKKEDGTLPVFVLSFTEILSFQLPFSRYSAAFFSSAFWRFPLFEMILYCCILKVSSDTVC